MTPEQVRALPMVERLTTCTLREIALDGIYGYVKRGDPESYLREMGFAGFGCGWSIGGYFILDELHLHRKLKPNEMAVYRRSESGTEWDIFDVSVLYRELRQGLTQLTLF